MNRLLRIVRPLAFIGLPVSLACMVLSDPDHLGIEQVLVIPLLIVSVAAFTVSLYIDAKIGRALIGNSIFATWIGKYHALLKAPIFVCLYSALGLFGTVLLGREGEANSFTDTPEAVQISFAVVGLFLTVSLPSLYTNHSAATK
jgi:hypothetical protein